VDDEDGDCFLAGLALLHHPVDSDMDYPMDGNAVGSDNDVMLDDDFQTLRAKFENVAEWLDPTALVYVSGPDSVPLAPPYGWKLHEFVCRDQSADTVCRLLKQYGMAIVQSNQQQEKNESSLEESDISTLYSKATRLLQEHIQVLEETVRRRHQHIRLGESAFGFQEYTHRGPGRFEVLFDPDNSEFYDLLRETLEPQWIECVCKYLGTSDINRLRLNISCVYSRPGSKDQEWHTDGDHYNFVNGDSINNSDYIDQVGANRTAPSPYALCIFVPLIPLTKECGYTRFWPKSHMYKKLLGSAQAADTCLQATVDAYPTKLGDYIAYDYTTWHKGMANTSTSTLRPIVQFLYSLDWYKEIKNYGTRSVFDFQ
jgi:hypothetical protein